MGRGKGEKAEAAGLAGLFPPLLPAAINGGRGTERAAPLPRAQAAVLRPFSVEGGGEERMMAVTIRWARGGVARGRHGGAGRLHEAGGCDCWGAHARWRRKSGSASGTGLQEGSMGAMARRRKAAAAGKRGPPAALLSPASSEDEAPEEVSFGVAREAAETERKLVGEAARRYGH